MLSKRGGVEISANDSLSLTTNPTTQSLCMLLPCILSFFSVTAFSSSTAPTCIVLSAFHLLLHPIIAAHGGWRLVGAVLGYGRPRWRRFRGCRMSMAEEYGSWNCVDPTAKFPIKPSDAILLKYISRNQLSSIPSKVRKKNVLNIGWTNYMALGILKTKLFSFITAVFKARRVFLRETCKYVGKKS